MTQKRQNEKEKESGSQFELEYQRLFKIDWRKKLRKCEIIHIESKSSILLV